MNKKLYKVGIITLFFESCNFGGLLQAYASKKALADMNIIGEQIAYNKKEKLKDKLKNREIITIVKSVIFKSIKFVKKQTKGEIEKKKKLKKLEKNLTLRKEKCRLFREEIKYIGPYNIQTIKECLLECSIFLTGSDQVWNPDWHKGAYYLDFVPKSVPKIAYAASIGKDELTKEQIEYAIPKIKRLDFISVREQEAKDLLAPYIDKKIKVVLDPTLLLTQKEWNTIAVMPKIEDPYIFVYLLGNNMEHRTNIKQIGKRLNLKIVFLPHIHFQYEPADENFADIDLYDVGPAEFVGLIKNAEMVITDSFHGCVFSIIYHKKFWALKRHKDTEKGNMNSRLYTLFSNLGLEERLLDDEQRLTEEELLSEIDYETVDEKLEVLRKDSMDFLENALSESVKMIEENQKKQKSKGN